MAIPGIRIRNNNSIVQIDSRYKNLAGRWAGSVTTSGAPSGTNYYSALLTLPYNAEQVCAFNSTAKVMLRSAIVSGSNITYRFMANANNATINVRIFDDPQTLSVSAGAGIRVRNPLTGQVAFDSRLKYMRVIDYRSGADSQTSNPSFNVSYPGTNLFVCQTQTRIDMTTSYIGQPPHGTQNIFWKTPVVQFSGSSCSMANDLIDSLQLNNSVVTQPSFRAGWGYIFINLSI